MTVVTINGVAFTPTVNESAAKRERLQASNNWSGVRAYVVEPLNDWSNKGIGNYRIVQAVDRMCKAVDHFFKEAGYGSIAWVNRLSEKVGPGVAVLILPRLTVVATEAYDTVNEIRERPFLGSIKENTYVIADRVSTLAEAVGSWSWAATLVSTNGKYKQLGEGFDLVKNLADLTTGAQDYYESNKLTVGGDDDVQVGKVQKNIKDTKKEAFLRIVKAVLGVAAPILGLLAIALSPATTLILKLASSTVAIGLDFFKDSMEFKPLKFFEEGAAMNARRAWV